MNDENNIESQSTTSVLPAGTLLAFARELRLLAAKVERDVRRHEPVSALSSLTAIKPLTGALTDAVLSAVMSEERSTPLADSADTAHAYNPLGYL